VRGTRANALVETVGALADHAIEKVLLGDERVTSAAEGKRLLAGNSELEARADKLQRLVVATGPTRAAIVSPPYAARQPTSYVVPAHGSEG
jgi:hypothetical protein